MKKLLLSTALLSILSLTSCSDGLNSFDDLDNSTSPAAMKVDKLDQEATQNPVISPNSLNGLGTSGETIQLPAGPR